MKERDLIQIMQLVNQVLKGSVIGIVLLLFAMLYMASDYFLNPQSIGEINQEMEQIPDIQDGIHIETGLIDDAGLELVIQNCTGCHSSRLITQNKMSLEGWSSTIKWMQETQNLWDLGENEQPILSYLATNYAPQKKGRRVKLENIEWYELE